MLRNFHSDLKEAKKAEQLALKVLGQGQYACAFEDVSNDPKYYYKGDIKIILPTGEEYYLEVKNDSRIAETHNILCEEEVYYKDGNYYGKGNMSGETDFYAVVSMGERKIYILDFKKLQRIYKQGIYKVIDHADQTTYCYLLALHKAKQSGALIDVLQF